MGDGAQPDRRLDVGQRLRPVQLDQQRVALDRREPQLAVLANVVGGVGPDDRVAVGVVDRQRTALLDFEAHETEHGPQRVVGDQLQPPQPVALGQLFPGAAVGRRQVNLHREADPQRNVVAVPVGLVLAQQFGDVDHRRAPLVHRLRVEQARSVPGPRQLAGIGPGRGRNQ